ncbi:CDP-alcohol phosphatidyltransferase family protein [Aliikangiella coralliicola]|uniref:CDP-diacylglycerol--glycerol-3-phosphate 3-phosphatidyltransferase n=1 Tax=Aliikangiella coralliicola TaxID=2592383 RepID=A0A545U551_9GAMM|nr:CDP-alcohol phosphatidyltransferase family protein [Aliikangiella coralliicola]TQV84533.1 CDP-alcohol phosphatidyltransferase family protein [Aliikangiella coralliicola]
MNWSMLPNFITLLRVVLLVPLSLLLLDENYTYALMLFIVAGFSDALDGFLAKHFSWVSRFGAIVDPLADKALLVVTMTILVINGVLSWTLLIVVAIRDIFIVAGAYYYHYRLGPYKMQPSYLSKFNTFIQLLLVSGLLVSLGYHPIPPTFITVLIWLTYFTTVSSGVHYGVVWGKKFKQELQLKKESQHGNDEADKAGENSGEGESAG